MMKATLVFLFLKLALSSHAFAQTASSTIRVFIRDTSNRAIFDLQPELKHFILKFDHGEANKVQVIYHKSKDKPMYTESYSMAFEGDRYALLKKYPGLKLPHAPKIEMASLYKVKNLADSNVHVEVTSYLQRDTIYHHFSHFILGKGVHWYTFTDPYSAPKLKEDKQVLEKRLNVAYQQWKPVAATDSTLVITAIVEQDGSMHDVKLLLGEASAFSAQVLDFISREVKPWSPAIAIRTKRIRAQAKIFVRLNKDDTISFSTL